MDHIESIVERARQAATADVAGGRDVRPRLWAARGPDEVIGIALPPVPRDDLEQTLVEALALLLGVHADRAAVATPGRLFSLDDPIPPVIDGVGDLRQHALAIATVDGRQRPPRRTARILPFDAVAGTIVWHDPVDPGPAEGWIVSGIERTLEAAPDYEVTDLEVGRQLVRCLVRGHEIDAPPGAPSRRLDELVALAVAELAREARADGDALPSRLPDTDRDPPPAGSPWPTSRAQTRCGSSSSPPPRPRRR